MNCLSCDNLDLQSNPKHAKQGLGRCAREKEAGVFVVISLERQCKLFKPGKADVVRTRVEWASKEGF